MEITSLYENLIFTTVRIECLTKTNSSSIGTGCIVSYHREEGDYYFDKGTIQVQPIGFLRGRTIVNSIFIIDETQNIDPGDIKSIVTRAAEGSKFIFLGDPTQVDNPKLNERYNGLVYLSEKMKDNELCWQISLKNEESVRSKLSTIASGIL